MEKELKDKRIVPFLFGIEKNPIHYSWIFYKYMDFALENDFPVIADEAYFVNPEIYEKQQEYSFLDIVDDYNYKHKFHKPTKKRMDQLKKYAITTEEKKEVLGEEEYSSILRILKKTDQKFEQLILRKIEKIEKECGSICAILTWTWFPSLYACCKKHNIQLISLEQTTFRPGTYQYTFGYFLFHNKFDSVQIDKDYEKFMKESKGENQFFSRRELLSFFLTTENLDVLKHLNDQCLYEIGYSVLCDYDPLAEALCECSEEDIFKQLSCLCYPNQISLRTHPYSKKTIQYEYVIDHSKNSLEWILKNRRIACISSNVAFETMLLGKTAYILGKNFPYMKGAVSSLDQLDDKIASLSYLNYIIFGYYVPYDLMFSKDYIYFRLENPSIKEIYDYNLKYFLEQEVGMDLSIFSLSPQDRLDKILKSSHKDLTKEKRMELLENKVIDYEKEVEKLNYCRKVDEENYQKELEKEKNTIKALEQNIEEEKRKYQEIINSKSWKATKPLRDVSRLIKKR